MKQTSILSLFLLITLYASGQDSLAIISKWKLIDFDTFDQIKNSPGYLLATDEERQAFDKSAKELLDSSMYEFKANGMMEYTDLQNMKIVKRVAYWKVSGGVLQIIERNRPYQREAKIIELNENQLILTPIIDGQVSTGKMVFRKM